MPEPGVSYVVLIWLRPGMREALHNYERAVTPIMSQHGGRFTGAMTVDTVSELPLAGRRKPDEIHVLWFPDADAFTAWRADPAMQALAEQRDSVAEHALFLGGIELSPAFET